MEGRGRKEKKKTEEEKKERLFAKDTVTKQTLKSNPIEPVSLTEKKKNLIYISQVSLFFGNKKFTCMF